MTIGVGEAVGISMSPRHRTETESLLRTADIAIYHAKRAGGAVIASSSFACRRT
jgi:predicted signal transduction protein with EAL and GGDEF domain